MGTDPDMYQRQIYLGGMGEFLFLGVLIATIIIYTAMFFMEKKRKEDLFFVFANMGLALWCVSNSPFISHLFPRLNSFPLLFKGSSLGLIQAETFLVLFFSYYKGKPLNRQALWGYSLLMAVTDLAVLAVPLPYLAEIREILIMETGLSLFVILTETVHKMKKNALHPGGIFPGFIMMGLLLYLRLFTDAPLAKAVLLHLALFSLVMQQLIYHTFLSVKNYKKVREMNREYLKLNRELKDSLNRIDDQAELINFISNRDSVSGLPNKNQFSLLFEREMSRVSSDGGTLLFVLAEWQDLKDYLSRRGPEKQVDTIRRFAERAVRFCGENDRVCRYSDDRFLFILSPEKGKGGKRVKELMREINRPLKELGGDYHPRIHMGYTLAGNRELTQEALLSQLFAALDFGKREKSSKPCRYCSRIENFRSERILLEEKFTAALREGLLEVYYQPQHESWQSELSGLEALLRWNDPDLGPVGPEEFIPLAEELGLIEEIDLYTAKSALTRMVEWTDTELSQVRLSLNISPTNFVNPLFIESLIALTRHSGISPSRIELELTETVLVYNRDQIRRNFTRLKKEGFSIALDDFGTGYSSLAYLTEFPVDVLKIDKAFITGLSGDKRKKDIVKSIIAIGYALGLRIISEGVEREEELLYLRKAGCHAIQGFYFSPPLSPAALPDYIRQIRSA
ncbi:MAG: EAL domain-containing protein [Spirochaetales bacterium]|nr:EAL domain-containing protein [Spirochaetales bacterium]